MVCNGSWLGDHSLRVFAADQCCCHIKRREVSRAKSVDKSVLALNVLMRRSCVLVGWSSAGNQPGQQFAGQYDNTGFGDQGGPGVKSRLINLIGAVRTLLRSEFTFSRRRTTLINCLVPLIIINIVVILYELVLG